MSSTIDDSLANSQSQWDEQKVELQAIQDQNNKISVEMNMMQETNAAQDRYFESIAQMLKTGDQMLDDLSRKAGGGN